MFEVSNTLGAGFLEKVYQRALLHELRRFPSRLMRRLWPGSHHFACPAISWTLHQSPVPVVREISLEGVWRARRSAVSSKMASAGSPESRAKSPAQPEGRPLLQALH
ncbi:MAG: hypothetical protein FJW37_04780 [Acidobacteria bacterium]|nr:hypothetical protein [Acidobacteriota bacterium]